MGHANRIAESGYPLGYRIFRGSRPAIVSRAGGESVYSVEAHILAGHQKEVIVEAGAGGSRWRLTSDEGKQLGGLDVAPFPLGLFNAGLSGDLQGRVAALAPARGLDGSIRSIVVRNFYWLTGSFVRGTGEGHAEPPEVRAYIRPGVDADAVRQLLSDAIDASPAFAAMRHALQNTFALSINGRRRAIGSMPTADETAAPDPFVTYATPPKPEADNKGLPDPITKSAMVEAGTLAPTPASATTKVVRTVAGHSKPDGKGHIATDVWLELPGASHFITLTDDRPDLEAAPTGLAFLTAGIAFCFMTQLSRYIEHMKLEINGVRMVQTGSLSYLEPGS